MGGHPWNMNRSIVAIIVAVLTVTAVLPAGTVMAQSGDEESQPGATLSGVVGVQQAELEGELAERTLDERLNRSESNVSKAKVVAEETERIEGKLEELEQRRENVTEAYENGEITEAQYKSELAEIGAKSKALEQRANKTGDVAEKLPEEALQEAGANVSKVRSLAENADEMTGQEVAEAARDIAGEGAGEGLDDDEDRPGRSGDQGADDEAGEERQAGDRTETEASGDQSGDASTDSGDGYGQDDTTDARDNAGDATTEDDTETESSG